MTESPIAVTCEPTTLVRIVAGAGAATAPADWPDVCARVAALMRSPLLTCCARPEDA
ncbi:MAG TPA: hypothetical protein VHJ18_27800 [Streptosporangiaceae bacterium]|nr:hypothetical protein [Streptosporangiaceae bacterium]